MSTDPMNEEPTHTMRLHIDNTPAPHHDAREVAAEAAQQWAPSYWLRHHYDDPDEGAQRRRAARISEAADALREWMEEQLLEPLENDPRPHDEWTRLLTVELLTDAIRATDWRTIAESYADQAREDAARGHEEHDPYADPPTDEDDEEAQGAVILTVHREGWNPHSEPVRYAVECDRCGITVAEIPHEGAESRARADTIRIQHDTADQMRMSEEA